jgi:hypothetical protein
VIPPECGGSARQAEIDRLSEAASYRVPDTRAIRDVRDTEGSKVIGPGQD